MSSPASSSPITSSYTEAFLRKKGVLPLVSSAVQQQYEAADLFLGSTGSADSRGTNRSSFFFASSSSPGQSQQQPPSAKPRAKQRGRRLASATAAATRPTLPLSFIVEKCLPQVLLLDGKRLSAVGRGVTVVDRLYGGGGGGKEPHRVGFSERMATQVTSVLLSNNDLVTCRGLEQFPNLGTLSLANNLLTRLEDLEALVALPCLESLLLEGNPVTQEEPNYRLCVLGMLPRLTTLDKVAVSAAEREAALGALKRRKQFWDQGLKHVCDAVQLTHVGNLLAVHCELREVVLAKQGGDFLFSALVRGGPDQQNLALTLKRLLEVRPVHILVRGDIYLRRRFEDLVRREADDVFDEASRRIHILQTKGQNLFRAHAATWEWACTTLLQRQQEVLQHLTKETLGTLEVARLKANQGGGYHLQASSPDRGSGRASSCSPPRRRFPNELHLLEEEEGERRAARSPTRSAVSGSSPNRINPPWRGGGISRGSSQHSSPVRSATGAAARRGGGGGGGSNNRSWPLLPPPAPQGKGDQPPPLPFDPAARRQEVHKRYTQLLKKRYGSATASVSSAPGRQGGKKPGGGRGAVVPAKPAPTARRRPAPGGGGGEDVSSPGPLDTSSVVSSYYDPYDEEEGNNPPHVSPRSLPALQRGRQPAMTPPRRRGAVIPSSPTISPVRSLVGSLPPQQEEPDKDSYGEEEEEEEEPLYHPAPLPAPHPFSLAAEERLFESLMDGHLPPPPTANRNATARSIKGLQQQVAAMHDDVQDHVQAETELYGLNKALRQRVEAIRRTRMEEAGAADARLAQAEAEMRRLGEGLERLRAREQHLARVQKEVRHVERERREVDAMVHRVEEERRQVEAQHDQAVQRYRQLQWRLEEAKAQVAEGIAYVGADEELAHAEALWHGLEKADAYRRSLLRRRPQSALGRLVRLRVFCALRRQLLWRKHVEVLVAQHLERARRVRALSGFWRWRAAALQAKAARLVAARRQLGTQAHVLVQWHGVYRRECKLKRLQAGRLIRRVRTALATWHTRAAARRRQREQQAARQARRVVRECFQAWKTYTHRRVYTTKPSFFPLASALYFDAEGAANDKAQDLFQALVLRRWQRRARHAREAREALGESLEAQQRRHLLAASWQTWRAALAAKRLHHRLTYENGNEVVAALDAMRARHRLGVLERAVVRWRLDVLSRQAQADAVLRVLAIRERRHLRQGLQQWWDGVAYVHRIERALDKATARRRKRLGRQVLWAWACVVKRERVLRQAQRSLAQWVKRRRQRTVFQAWRGAMQAKAAEQAARVRSARRVEWQLAVRERQHLRWALKRWCRWVAARHQGKALVRRFVEREDRLAKHQVLQACRAASLEHRRAAQQQEHAVREHEASRQKAADSQLRAMQEGLLQVQAALLDALKSKSRRGHGDKGGGGDAKAKAKQQQQKRQEKKKDQQAHAAAAQRIEMLQAHAKQLQHEVVVKQRQVQRMEEKELARRQQEKERRRRRAQDTTEAVGQTRRDVLGQRQDSRREMAVLDEELGQLRQLVHRAEATRKGGREEASVRDGTGLDLVAMPYSSLLGEDEDEDEDEELDGAFLVDNDEEEDDPDLADLEHMRGEISLLEHRIKFRFQGGAGRVV